MPTDWEFSEYLGTDLPLKVGVWTVVPKSRFVPSRSGILTPNVYINAKFVIPDTAKEDGTLWVRLMRENPNDGTMNYYLTLPRGHSTVLDSRCFQKRWGIDDLKRAVHLEVKVSGVTSAYLNDSCYVSYSQIW